MSRAGHGGLPGVRVHLARLPMSRLGIRAGWIVLDSNGRPDDSFGVSIIGQPAASLSFRTG